jgi:aspartyl-tRNA synthetase
VTLNGWVHSVRSHGDLVFVDLRDRTGIVQLRADASSSSEVLQALGSVKNEYVLAVTGEVQMRAPGMANPKLDTGEIEIQVAAVDVLNTCRQPLPFQVNDEAHMALVNEELRLRYRYLDLRRPSMYRMLSLRHQVVAAIRRFLDARGFLEIETPIFTRSTPEGARDYLVPYRLSPGLFYALPQSPQQYKQLLMVAGVERYYQIARCFRDEAQRADRQPEFTQLDMEMSFVTQEDILSLSEELTIAVVQECSNKRLGAVPFTRLTYDEAMRRFGTDKPDLRYGLEIADLSDCLAQTSFGVFRDTLGSGGVVRCLRYPGGTELSRRELDELARLAKEWGAKGLAHLAVETSTEGGSPSRFGKLSVRGPVAKYLSDAEQDAVLALTAAEPGDLLLMVADTPATAATVLGRLRGEIGRRLGLASSDVLHFCWITDFPLVQWNPDEGRWDAEHHPFTMPHEEDLPFLDSDPGRVRAQCYDIVCNGVEWGSGSIRICRPDIQARVFALLGLSEDIQRERFGHMLDAFAYGAPPHGGIAPGIDRLLMLLTDTDNIREVMAFPKIGGGSDPLMGAPSTVDEAQLRELGLRIVPPD